MGKNVLNFKVKKKLETTVKKRLRIFPFFKNWRISSTGGKFREIIMKPFESKSRIEDTNYFEESVLLFGISDQVFNLNKHSNKTIYSSIDLILHNL